MRCGRAIAAAVCLSAGCAQDATPRRIDTGLVDLALRSVRPEAVLPGTEIVVEGDSFVDDPWGTSRLLFEGELNGELLEVRLPAEFLDFEHLEVEVDDNAFDKFGGTGSFAGIAVVEVESAVDGRTYRSAAIDVVFEVTRKLTPNLSLEQSEGIIFPNEPLRMTGEGLLLEGEGDSVALVEGCFIAEGGEECVAVAPQEVPILPADPLGRDEGNFAFAPVIAGIEPGAFEGTVIVRNRSKGGEIEDQEAQGVSYSLEEPIIFGADTTSASLGQFITITGGGFVGNDGSTQLLFVGEYTRDATGVPAPIDVLLVPEFVDGRTIRYVIAEDDAIGQLIDVRFDPGTFEGLITPEITWGGTTVSGDPTPIQFRLEPVLQVVYVEFLPAYTESLRHFGLRAVDSWIRSRVVEVIERDFASINVEIRTELPNDFALFAQVEIGGPDPNGLGLLGYDNTPGKDTENQRLYDRIGGVNRETQEDGYPGYGGVFIESLLGYSEDAAGFTDSTQPDERFDALIDPFRPDRGGTPILAVDLGGDVKMLSKSKGCPAEDSNRSKQIGCAVLVLGNLIGTTVSHEIAHSLGLADPYGPLFHNPGDQENRMMDSDRPFGERAEIDGDGPSKFCLDEYDYLRAILPTDEPYDPGNRATCF